MMSKLFSEKLVKHFFQSYNYSTYHSKYFKKKYINYKKNCFKQQRLFFEFQYHLRYNGTLSAPSEADKLSKTTVDVFKVFAAINPVPQCNRYNETNKRIIEYRNSICATY